MFLDSITVSEEIHRRAKSLNHGEGTPPTEEQPRISFGNKVIRLLGFEKPQPIGHRDLTAHKPGVFIKSAEGESRTLSPELIENIKDGSALEPKEGAAPPTAFDI